jgi:predicted dehydrogenase
VIGLGVGERHIEGYRLHPGCEVVALCDFSQEKLEMAARKYPGVHLTDRAEDVLRSPEVDVVSIASYDNHHCEQVVQAIGGGKHVFVEKPLCLNRDEALAIRKALAENPRVMLSSNLILRRCPRFVWLKRLIGRGGMGTVFCMDGDYNYGRIGKILEGWRGRIDGYAAILGGGVHLVDLMLWLSGRKVVEVSAISSNLATRGSGFRYDDYCSALLRFEDGMAAKVSANLACVHPHFHNLAVYGTEATFVNGHPNGRLIRSRDPEAVAETVAAAYPGSAKGDLIPGFLDSINGSAPPEITVEEIFAAMSVCFAIMESAVKRTVVPVEYI